MMGADKEKQEVLTRTDSADLVCTERKGVILDTEASNISYIEGDEKEKTLWQVRRQQ